MDKAQHTEINKLIDIIPEDIICNKDLEVVILIPEKEGKLGLRFKVNGSNVADICAIDNRIVAYGAWDYNIIGFCATPDDISFSCKHAKHNEKTDLDSKTPCPYTALCEKIKEFAKAFPVS